MWHEVTKVAANNKIDPAELVDFAVSHDEKYGIEIHAGDALISSWFVRDLINEFKISKKE